MDFWRPNYADFPFVDGHFSSKQYLDCLTTTFCEYKKRHNKNLLDFNAFCFHLPFPKLGLKGLNSLFSETENLTKEKKAVFLDNFYSSIVYSKRIGNIYTGSLYLSLLSLLENCQNLKAGDVIGMYSYGSGAVCEIFSITVVDGFKNQLINDRIKDFDERKRLSTSEYEKMFFEQIELDEYGNSINLLQDNSLFYLEKIENHKRIYKKRGY